MKELTHKDRIDIASSVFLAISKQGFNSKQDIRYVAACYDLHEEALLIAIKFKEAKKNGKNNGK